MAEALEDRRLLATTNAFGETWGDHHSYDGADPNDPEAPPIPSLHVGYQVDTAGTGIWTGDGGSQFNKATATVYGLPDHAMVRVVTTPLFYLTSAPTQGVFNSVKISAGGKTAEYATDMYTSTGSANTNWFSHTGSTLSVTLEDGTGASSNGSWVVPWHVEVYTPTVSISGGGITLDEDDTTPVELTVSRDLPTDYVGTSGGDDALANLNVGFTTSGTATLGSDYTISPASSVTITNSAASASVWLQAVDDHKNERVEAIVAQVGSGSGYTLGTNNSVTVSLEGREAVKDAAAEAVKSLQYEPGATVPSWMSGALDGLSDKIRAALEELPAKIVSQASGSIANAVKSAIETGQQNNDPAATLPPGETSQTASDKIGQEAEKLGLSILGIAPPNETQQDFDNNDFLDFDITGKLWRDLNDQYAAGAKMKVDFANGANITLVAGIEAVPLNGGGFTFNFAPISLDASIPVLGGTASFSDVYNPDTGGHQLSANMRFPLQEERLRLFGANFDALVGFDIDVDYDSYENELTGGFQVTITR